MWLLKSLRWRLTLFYVSLMLALVLGLGIFVYYQLDGFLTDSSANRLSYEAAPKLTPGPAVKKENGTAEDTFSLLQQLNTQTQTLNSQTVYAATYTADGQPVTSSSPTTVPPSISSSQLTTTATTTGSIPAVSLKSAPTAGQFDAARTGKSYHYVEEGNGPGRLVVLIIPVTARQLNGPEPALPPADKKAGAVLPGVASDPVQVQGTSLDNIVGFVVLAQPLFEADQILGQLRLILLLGAAGTIIIILLLGLPVARLGLAPLKKMTLTAQRIAGGDLTQRVALKPLNDRKTDKEAKAGTELRAKTGVWAGFKGTDDEVRQLTVAFNQMLDQIEAAFQGQQRSEARTRQFVADASHELRTPLTTLGGSLDVLLMQAEKFPPQTQKFLRTMQREIDRLSRLVVNLLQLTRLDAAGSQAVHLEPVRLDLLIEQTFEGLGVLAGTRHLCFENKKHLEEGTGTVGIDDEAEHEAVWVQADSDRLRQVLTNLIDNAIRYTQPDGTIMLRTQIVSSLAPSSTTFPVTADESANPGDKNTLGKNWVKLEVADNGAGIAPDHQKHIFDRFYRVDEARVGTGANGNAGLGLSIVQAIIEAHHGRISVTSEVGKGTIFTIYLPAGSGNDMISNVQFATTRKP